MTKRLSFDQKYGEECFENFFQQNWEKIYKVLFQLTGQIDEAEDITLDVFIQLWQKPPSHQENVSGWLYRIAMNKGYNALRSHQRRIKYETEAGLKRIERMNQLSPEVLLDKATQRKLIQSTLNKMPKRQAQLLLLRHADLSYNEIAEILQIAPVSVGKLINRAAKKFCQIYLEGE
ncbi:MAG: sigma-70 family RNA polymerase sigma factor [Anaerolineaceae bacterium]|nr:sigma-70 family RNA polymerase sigma factor [Anaerolineaceae bacterium]